MEVNQRIYSIMFGSESLNRERHARRLKEPLQKWFTKDLELNGRFLNRDGEFQDLRSLIGFSGSSTEWDWSTRRVRGVDFLNSINDAEGHFVQ